MDKDPVLALKKLEKIEELSIEFYNMTSDMQLTAFGPEGISDMHPFEEMEKIIDACRSRILSSYGKMMWESADGAIESSVKSKSVTKSHSKKDIHDLPNEILSELRSKPTKVIRIEAAKDGESVQSGSRNRKRKKREGLLSRLRKWKSKKRTDSDWFDT